MKIYEFLSNKRNAAIIVLLLFLIMGIAGGLSGNQTGYATRSTPTNKIAPVTDSNNNPQTTQPTTIPAYNRNHNSPQNPSDSGSTLPPEEPQGIAKVGETTVAPGKSTSVGTINK